MIHLDRLGGQSDHGADYQYVEIHVSQFRERRDLLTQQLLHGLLPLQLFVSQVLLATVTRTVLRYRLGKFLDVAIHNPP